VLAVEEDELPIANTGVQLAVQPSIGAAGQDPGPTQDRGHRPDLGPAHDYRPTHDRGRTHDGLTHDLGPAEEAR
jgi:hypothetical protein